MARILLVEDDQLLARAVRTLLQDGGYAVDHVTSGEDALALAPREPYGCIVLDIGLPGLSGFETLKSLRAGRVTMPVLILTARGDRDDRVRGLDLGADDYLMKPFEPLELLARLRALLRRGNGTASARFAVGNLVCDTAAAQAEIDGRPLSLRRREWAVLHALAQRPGKVVSKDRLVAEVFGYDDPVGTNAIEVYITRLRKKLRPDGPAIRSFRGLGYLLDVPPQ